MALTLCLILTWAALCLTHCAWFCFPLLGAPLLSSSTFSLTHPSSVWLPLACTSSQSQLPLAQVLCSLASALHAWNLWDWLVHSSYCQLLSHADSIAKASLSCVYLSSQFQGQETKTTAKKSWSLAWSQLLITYIQDQMPIRSLISSLLPQVTQRHSLTCQICSYQTALLLLKNFLWFPSAYTVNLKLLHWDLWPFWIGNHLSATSVFHYSLLVFFMFQSIRTADHSSYMPILVKIFLIL